MTEQNATEEDELIDRSGHKWWVKSGFIWGFLLWIAMCILLPVYKDVEFSIRLVLINLPICLITGLLFGLGIKLIKHYLKPPGQ